MKLIRDEILNASPEQLREWVAVHVMGWTWREDDPKGLSCPWSDTPGWWHAPHWPDDEWACAHCTELYPYLYSSDVTHIWNIETSIQKRGLVERYTDALIDVLGLDMQVFNSAIELDWWHGPEIPDNQFNRSGYAYLWLLMRASPEQRCRAALLAVMGEEEE